MLYKIHTSCRVCGNTSMIPYLDLGMMPLSNNLAKSPEDPIHTQTYPLVVNFCDKCGLSQLSIVVNPEEMFSNYVYRSSISQGYINHCKEMAISLKNRWELDKNSFHIDIAGNDCALLEQFSKVIGGKILNIDPAINLKPICDAAEIPTITYFWGKEIAEKIVEKYGYANLITATNVFAHVDNVEEFMEAVKIVLMKEGVLVMEFPYLIDFIQKNEFDTIYFEHLSYFSVTPLKALCNSIGLNIVNVEEHAIHGGSLRVTIGRMDSDGTAEKFIEKEKKYLSIDRCMEFSIDVKNTIEKMKEGVRSLDGTLAGFAASAKGNTLLNSSMITSENMRYIVDETPEKIGKYSPGTRIPIVSMIDLIRTPPDYLMILSWNFADEIIEKVRKAGYKGKFIIPIPEFTIVE